LENEIRKNLTPEEAEALGVSCSVRVISPDYGLKSKTSIGNKKTPSSDGSEVPENSVQSEGSGSRVVQGGFREFP